MLRIIINNNKKSKEIPDQKDSVSTSTPDSQSDKNERQLNDKKNQIIQSDILKATYTLDIKQKIELRKKEIKELVNNDIAIKIQEIYSIQELLKQLKQIIVQEVDNIIENAEQWIRKLNCLRFDQVLKNQNLQDNLNGDDQFLKQQIDKINQQNRYMKQRIIKQLQRFKNFKGNDECFSRLNNIQINDNNNEYILIGEDDQVTQNDIISVSEEKKQVDSIQEKIKLKLIDNKNNKQDGRFESIVFDKTGSIMVSNDMESIKIWRFEKGELSLQNQLQIHNLHVKCLVYSKFLNNFISGSADKKIICWKQVNLNKWNSNIYQYHYDTVNCLILNQKEDELISGSDDKQIIIWSVDFINNQLTYKYSLKQHSEYVLSLSYNQSENSFLSCGSDLYIIWKKKTNIDNQQVINNIKSNEFQYYLDQLKYLPKGNRVIFINDYQFLWVTQNQGILVFEQKWSMYQQNKNKTINIKNNDCEDQYYFPIIYNKNKNFLLIKHKYHIYLIRQLENGKFIIISSVDCGTQHNYGTITNDGQYLVFWDQKLKKYSTYQILQV
ncbi:unnamed protein product [Paramecium pentaurelia]|uniref:WD40-repeat-containing domain n=1 Tax=Paramecium pentaurelia TaxID=43138 RepID=A0A8S1VI22_9CILI|nr:unnamed protein product [Paramecium pentaurelia]